MKPMVKTVLAILLTNLLLAACSGTPEPKRDPYNDADSQRTRADKAQTELSTEARE